MVLGIGLLLGVAIIGIVDVVKVMHFIVFIGDHFLDRLSLACYHDAVEGNTQ
jgi:hypothetical protein